MHCIVILTRCIVITLVLFKSLKTKVSRTNEKCFIFGVLNYVGFEVIWFTLVNRSTRFLCGNHDFLGEVGKK